MYSFYSVFLGPYTDLIPHPIDFFEAMPTATRSRPNGTVSLIQRRQNLCLLRRELLVGKEPLIVKLTECFSSSIWSSVELASGAR